jgi:hypothetical protein
MQYVISVEVDDVENSQLDLANNDGVRKVCEFAIRGVLLQAMSARLQTCWFDGYSGNGCLDAGSFDPAPAAPVPDAVQQHLAANKLDDKDLFRGR